MSVYDTEWYKEQVVIAKRQNLEHVAKHGRSFNGIMAKADADGGADIAKARDRHDVGGKGLASATAELALDLIHHHRRRLGLAKSGGQLEAPMKDTVYLIMKDCGGPVTFAKTICDTGRSYGVSGQEYVESASRHESELYGLPGDRAFANLCEKYPVILQAYGVLKAADFSVFDIKPVVVGGTDAQDVDNATVAVRAYEEIVRIGREKFPFLPADQQFARIFENKNYAALAAQAHRRPGPTTIYEMPGSTDPGRGAYTKADPAPSADSAYSELMEKAEAYRSAHTDLSIAQCFEKIYTDRANVELAKRERRENAAR
jgi:hypothetical protein